MSVRAANSEASVKDLSVTELRSLIEDTVRKTLSDSIEDLEALRSPAYLSSIAKAREDYRAGRTVPIEEIAD